MSQTRRKKLDEVSFDRAVAQIAADEQTIRIAHAVLVRAHKQADVAAQFGVTQPNVSRAVTRVWRAAQQLGNGAKKKEVVVLDGDLSALNENDAIHLFAYMLLKISMDKWNVIKRNADKHQLSVGDYIYYLAMNDKV